MKSGQPSEPLSQTTAAPQREAGQRDTWDRGVRSPCELAAYNAGVRVALSVAGRTADAIEKLPTYKEGRAGFAAKALREFAAAGAELLLASEPAQAGSGGAST
jgi:hypothetical protein